jgi:hypothetical protein
MDPHFAALTAAQNAAINDALDTTKPDEVVVQQTIDRNLFEVNRRDLVRLNPRIWLNDAVINFYMQLIVDRNVRQRKEGLALPSITAVTSFLYTQLMNVENPANSMVYEYGNVARWMRRAGKDLFAFDMVFIPVNKGRNHWILVVVYNKARRIQAFDSFQNENIPILKNLQRYLGDEWNRTRPGQPFPTYTLGPLPPSYTGPPHIIGEKQADIPRQSNGYDCGVFTCMFADYISEQYPLTFTEANIPFFRRRIVHAVLERALPSTVASEDEEEDEEDLLELLAAESDIAHYLKEQREQARLYRILELIGAAEAAEEEAAQEEAEERGALYGKYCSKSRQAVCGSQGGCVWKKGRGCRRVEPLPPPVGCSKLKSRTCETNPRCEWVGWCRIKKLGGGYDSDFYGMSKCIN